MYVCVRVVVLKVSVYVDVRGGVYVGSGTDDKGRVVASVLGERYFQKLAKNKNGWRPRISVSASRRESATRCGGAGGGVGVAPSGHCGHCGHWSGACCCCC